MADKDTIKKCKDRIETAEAEIYTARAEAIDDVLDGAEAWQVMSLLSWALGSVISDMCDEHRAEIRDDLIGMIDSATVEHDKMYAEFEAEEKALAETTMIH